MANVQETDYLRAEMIAMMEAKDKVEAEIANLRRVLVSHGVGMSEPLVDEEGYPRNDIDVSQVRHARHKIICLQNDHKDIMKKIEAGINTLFDRERVLGQNGAQDVNMGNSRRPPQFPFATVNLVHPGSPADMCGMCVGDLIVEFGSVNYDNFKSLRDIRSVVEHSVGQKVVVCVIRDNCSTRLLLTPQTWHGDGLLGCNLVAVENVER